MPLGSQSCKSLFFGDIGDFANRPCSPCSSQTVLGKKTQLTSRRLRKVSSGRYTWQPVGELGSGVPQPATAYLRGLCSFPGSALSCYSGSKFNSKKNSEESTPLCIFLALIPWRSPLAVTPPAALWHPGEGDQSGWAPYPWHSGAST